MPLLSKFRMNGRVWKVRYEGFKMICFECGRMGHNTEKCLELQTKNKESSEAEMNAKEYAKHPKKFNSYGDKGKTKIQEGTTAEGLNEPVSATGTSHSGQQQIGKKQSQTGPGKKSNSVQQKDLESGNSKDKGSRFAASAGPD
ncbi:hypothetical protein V2J09_023118 [Rumex salicifolius]